MKIALIGAGNVAWHMGKALHKAGHEIAAVYSPTASHRMELAQHLPPAVPASSANFTDSDVELVILAAPDAALEKITRELQVSSGTLVVHTSGSQPLQALQGIAGAKTGVFYPLQTFSKDKTVDFKAVPILLEATDKKTLDLLQSVAGTISNEIHVVDSDKRKQLHLAAVFACNFTNHLLGISREILAKAGLPDALLQPLITETVVKAASNHPFQVQTGPAVRHDHNVIEAHLSMLQGEPLYYQLYQLLTQSIQNQQKQGQNQTM